MFTPCGSPCGQSTCFPSFGYCPAGCEPGCFCPGDQVEHNGACISPFQCPVGGLGEPVVKIIYTTNSVYIL